MQTNGCRKREVDTRKTDIETQKDSRERERQTEAKRATKIYEIKDAR
jgi:hypothetical protein